MVLNQKQSLFLNTLFCIGLFQACTQVYAIPVNLVAIPSSGIKYPIYVACECDYSLYVDGQYIEHDKTEVKSFDYLETGWNSTKRFYPFIYDESPKIIAFRGNSIANEYTGLLNGFIMNMNDGKDYTKYQEWKCADFSKTESKAPPVDWFTFDYDDSDWEFSTSFGKNYQNNSFQIFETERREINLQAEWLWTSDNSVTNVYCRKKNENVKTIPIVLTTIPAQTSAPTHVSTTIHTPAPVQTSAPTRVQTSAPSVVQTSAPRPVQTSAPTRVQTSAPSVVQTSAPSVVQTSAPTRVQTSAPTRVSTTIHTPAPVQTSAPAPVQTSAPSVVQTSAPAPVQTSAPAPVQTSAPAPVQTSAPTRVQTSAPARVQTSAPTRVQTSAPSVVQTSAPTRVQTSAPTRVQTSAPTPVQTSAPRPVQTSAPRPVQTSAPRPVQTSAPSHVSTTIHTPTVVQTSAPRPVQTSAPTRVQTSAPSVVQTSAPTRVSTTIHTPAPVQTSAPTRVQTSVHPNTVPNIVISPHIQIIIQNIKYSQMRSNTHIHNLFRKLKLYNDEYTLYKQLTIARLHLRQHYNALFYDIKRVLEKQNIYDSAPNLRKKTVKNIPHYIHSMYRLNKTIEKIEESIKFITGNHKYILLKILNKLKTRYQHDTEQLFTLTRYTE